MKGTRSRGHSDTVNRFPRMPMMEPSGVIALIDTSKIANDTDAK